MKKRSDALANKQWCVLLGLLLFVVGSSCAQRARPLSLMVIPSDNHLKRLNCLVEKKPQGEVSYERQYLKAFINEIDLEFAVSAIQGKFAERGLQLLDLQQTLRDMPNQELEDDLEDIDNDNLSRVLRYARPDIILELTYDVQGDAFSKLVFILNAKDAYTKKAVVTVQHDGFDAVGKNVAEALSDQVEQNMQRFITGFQIYREDMDRDGREVIIRVVSKEGVISDFREDECGGTGEPWNNWLMDWIEKNEKPGGKGFSSKADSPKEQKFSIYIDLFDAGGKAIGAADIARKLIKDIKQVCGVKATRSSKGLGEAIIYLKPQ